MTFWQGRWGKTGEAPETSASTSHLDHCGRRSWFRLSSRLFSASTSCPEAPRSTNHATKRFLFKR